MKYFLKANIYEMQAILYWIMGLLILWFGQWHWVGWVSIAWGWFTMIYTLFFIARHSKEIKNLEV